MSGGMTRKSKIDGKPIINVNVIEVTGKVIPNLEYSKYLWFTMCKNHQDDDHNCTKSP